MCQVGSYCPLVSTVLSCFVVLHVWGSIDIIDLQVPQSVDGSSDQPLILDCVYKVENESGLEVKWFFNDDQQIALWIPGLTKMQGIGRFASLIDTDYKASKEANSIYRALYIREASLDMTGNYTCKVSSDFHEDVETKEMIVYESAKEFELVHEDLSDTVICSANGLYPQPLMTLSVKYLTDSNDTVPILDTDEDLFVSENGTYGAVNTLHYDYLDGPVEFTCTIVIPETDYNVETTLRYYTDFGLPASSPTTWLIFAALLAIGRWRT